MPQNEDIIENKEDSSIIENNLPLLTISYNITNDETSTAFKLYQRKFVFVKNILYTIAYAVLAALFIQAIITDPSYHLGYGLVLLCVVLAVTVWIQPYNVRKKLLKALKDINDDSYVTSFYEDRFEIETKVTVKDKNAVELKIDENVDDVVISEPVTVTNYLQKLSYIENEDLFVMFVNKKIIYAIPKRCLSQTQEDKLREIINEKF